MYTINNEEDYISVTFTGNISFSSLLDAFLGVTAQPGYQHRNRIWIFRENGETSLSLLTISSVITILLKLDPQNKRRNKVAIVFQNGLQKAVAALFADEAKKVSCRMDLFGNLDSAVQWVRG
jgi:hypothetical protein